MSRLDIESLRVYTAVVDCGRVGVAAQRLNLTQSAVSHKLKRLESRVGMKLVKRNSDGFASSEQAERFLTYARRLISLHDEMLLNYPISSSQGKIVLGATEDATHTALARILGLYRRTHPKVSLQIRIAQSLVLEDWLKDGTVDLAILQVFDNKVKRGDHRLWADTLKWVVSPDYLLDASGDIPFVSFSEHCFYRQAAEKALKKQGRKLNVVFECQSVRGVNEAVKQGIGIALVTESVVDRSLVIVDSDLPVLAGITHVMRMGTTMDIDGIANLKKLLVTELASGLQ